jgi:single-stranded-DNA-specific exonuclease
MKEKIIYDSKSKKVALKNTKYNPVVAEILFNRGYETEKEMDEFFTKKTSKNYGELKDLEKAADIIVESIKNKEQIVIYSDTDTDGCMSAVVGMRLLSKIKAKVDYYTNDKFRDGYGLCKTGIDNILKKNPDTKLIVTADNGISAKDISYAKEKSLKVVVTDHHEAPEVLPDADAIVDPKQKDCNYKFKGLCGATVLYKVLVRVYEKFNLNEKLCKEALPYIAFATVGDVVPIVEENREIVRKGLDMMNSNPDIAFRKLKEIIGIEKFNSHDVISYKLTPMVNSLTRIEGSIDPAIKLFLTEDEEEAKKLIHKMDSLNNKRKKLTKEHYGIAKLMIEKPLKNVIVLYHKDFPEGIVGIIAGKIKEEYNRPTIILTDADDSNILVGSARSIENFHLKKALDRIDKKNDYLKAYGGHKKAAGMSVYKKDFKKFKEAIEKESESLSKEDLRKKIRLDATLKAKDVTTELIERIYEKLGPFGEKFQEPVIGITYKTENVYYMGSEKQHVKCVDKNFSVICWNGTQHYNKIEKPKGKAIGRLSVNKFNGSKTPQIIVQNKLIY